MCRRYYFHNAFHSCSTDGFHVALQYPLERLPGLPFRVLQRELLDAIKCEQRLCIHRIFDPQGTVIIESRNAFLPRYDRSQTGVYLGCRTVSPDEPVMSV